VAIHGGHPITEGLPPTVTVTDEWYDFEMVGSGAALTVLATLDEGSYEGGSMGENHPIAWVHEVSGGRAVYIGFGHIDEVFVDPAVSGLLANSLRWLTTPPGS
jgi:type 1 glutamine amidotransferase